MRADVVAGNHDLLDGFVQEVFAPLARKDQRAKGSLYLQGLLLEGTRKSIQSMGSQLGLDYEQLQQFVSVGLILVSDQGVGLLSKRSSEVLI